MLFSVCVCLYMNTMAERKSYRHRSELEHLFISRAPPLNQTEPDPGHWPPDGDYNVVRVRTAGPSHTLLGVILTTSFLQSYRLELSHTVTSVTTQLKMPISCWFVESKFSCVLFFYQYRPMKQNKSIAGLFSTRTENLWRLWAKMLFLIKENCSCN